MNKAMNKAVTLARALAGALAWIGLVLVITTTAAVAKSAHDFDFTSIEGDPLPMSKFAGKAVLLVNTASFCGYTPQYTDLQVVWERYRERGLVVLGVPSNDFGSQEPHGEEAIKEFCTVNFDVDFPMTTKQQVRGRTAHPLYRWIGDELGGAAVPKWNFHKILIGPAGEPVQAWPSRVKPTDPPVIDAIEAVLGQ